MIVDGNFRVAHFYILSEGKDTHITSCVRVFHPALCANGSSERKVSILRHNSLKLWIFVILYGGFNNE